MRLKPVATTNRVIGLAALMLVAATVLAQPSKDLAAAPTKATDENKAPENAKDLRAASPTDVQMPRTATPRTGLIPGGLGAKLPGSDDRTLQDPCNKNPGLPQCNMRR